MKILVVDDDPNIREVICFALEKAELGFETAGDGAKALKMARNQAFDLMVLDVGLPEMDGLDVCRELRKSSDLPILFLSARDEEIDRILGLELGGDDYVTKPFSPRELVARIKSILKRSAKKVEAPLAQHLEHGLLTLDTTSRDVSFDETSLEFTAKEFSLLATLLAQPTMVFSREQLMNAAYNGSIYVSDRTIDSHIRNIRAKLSDVGCSSVVETVHGVGFKLGKCMSVDG